MSETAGAQEVAVVFVIDDDTDFLLSMEHWLPTEGFRAYGFSSAECFLNRYNEFYDAQRPGCLLADLRMPGMSGLQLQHELSRRGIDLPVVILTGHADVAGAVSALKAGAVDFLEKPAEPDRLLEAIRQAVDRDVHARTRRQQRSNVQQRLERLAPREREVLDWLVKGYTPKQIALKLGTSQSTVRKQRANLLKKMEARTIAELIRMLTAAGFNNHANNRRSG